LWDDLFSFTLVMPKYIPEPTLLDKEITYEYYRDSGPGGQNVNKVSTAVRLRFNIINSPSIPVSMKKRLIKLAGSRLTQDGDIIIEAKRHRTQEQNRAEAERRFLDILQIAMVPPKHRYPSQPTNASRLRRLESKKHHGLIKSRRSKEKHEF
jgi:ribosome-associated protein